MTVRECFEKTFGPIPDGATCHIGTEVYQWPIRDACERAIHPTYAEINLHSPSELNKWHPHNGDWDWHPFGPDISDRPAESFRGFFGVAYDAALDEAKGEAQEWIEKLKAVPTGDFKYR